MKQIITIGRQFGSGGREIGLKLAEKLGLKCYDKEILQAAARKMDIAPSILARSEESNTSLLYSLLMGTGTNSAEDQLAKYETKFLRQQAEKGSCVIVGRCGSYVFRDDPALISFYITAPIEKRIERIVRLYGLDEEEALRKIQSMDKKRANYYYYHTDKKWTDLSQYQFILDSSVFGVEGTVELMEKIINQREGK
ncbi:MAG: cytidylate kinase-like family protein [Oscillospiraceae bacterium]|nr:cytidylate kinase-like family protein [Oscillospiraceae bacterium]